MDLLHRMGIIIFIHITKFNFFCYIPKEQHKEDENSHIQYYFSPVPRPCGTHYSKTIYIEEWYSTEGEEKCYSPELLQSS